MDISTSDPERPRIPDGTLKGPCECITESSTYDECSYLISGVATGIVVIGNIAFGLKSSKNTGNFQAETIQIVVY